MAISGHGTKKGTPWQRHIFPGSCPPSIVCAGAFHFRVRDGNGWVRSAPVTKRFLVRSSIHDAHRTWQVPFDSWTTMKIQAFVGCSGWHYEHWRGRFYPPLLPKSRWLSYYATRFHTVELNSTFYRLPTESAVANWANQAVPGFLFAVKGSRYVTHILRLRDSAASVGNFCDRMGGLATHLGPVLWQLPPSMRRDDTLLQDFLAVLPSHLAHTVEFRHPSWWTDSVYEMLHRHGVAFCLYNMEATSTPIISTADFTYIRFHGTGSRYEGKYEDASLEEWASVLQGLHGSVKQVFAYFNNDASAYAVENAERLRTLLGAL